MTAAAVAIVVVALAASSAARQPGAGTIRLVTDSPEGAVAAGVRFGAEEMARTMALLRRGATFEETRVTGREEAELLVGRVPLAPRTFLILDLDPAAACGVMEALARNDVSAPIVFLPRILDEPCGGGVLRLRATAAQRKTLLDNPAFSQATIDEWHPRLFRFGAEQLNDRFERQTGGRMNGDSWTGWFAMKVAAEAMLRLDPPGFAAIAGGQIVFDGHKGVPLRFDDRGLLRQPVYAIAGDGARVLAEISPDLHMTREAQR